MQRSSIFQPTSFMRSPRGSKRAQLFGEVIPGMRTKELQSQMHRRFLDLSNEWKEATGFLSSVTQICTHPSYQQIIGMGEVVVPWIISALRREPDHWFWALSAITGRDPVRQEHRGNLQAMAEDWIEWYQSS